MRSSTKLVFAIWCLMLVVPTVLAKAAADYYVHSLPGQPSGPLLKMHAGHIEVVPEHHGNLWFWHFQNRHLANRHRTILWLNGGPGCSSLDGALMEVGPYRLKDDQNLVYNEGSWDEFANLLFVDNPVGTGFSYVDTDSYVHELDEMASHMITFLEKFFGMFPEYEDNDLYLAGESFAGQHIPYIAKAVFDRNKNNVRHSWNLKGLLMGNGWIAPKEQSEAYVDYAYKAGILKKGSTQATEIENMRATCLEDVSKSDKLHVSYPNCEKILTKILTMSVDDGGTCVNMYDVRLRDTSPQCGMNWPPDLEWVTPYLRRSDVVQALHVNPEKKPGWTECSGAVGGAFRARNSDASFNILPDILTQVPVVLFSGEKDLICNHMGTEALINNMEWNGGKGFELSPGTIAPRQDWVFEGEPAGFYQEARNLTYVLFYNSSHMVPFNYPRRTRDMIDRFMGVDIASIGGMPADSRIDGEKGLETSVGGHPNSTMAEEEEKKKLEEERWSAYYRSGAVALVVVIVLASAFTWYVWQDRRRRSGYKSLFGSAEGDFGSSLMQENRSGVMRRDVEAVDFDENELDDLRRDGRNRGTTSREIGLDDEERYSLGGVSSEEEADEKNKARHGTAGA